MADLRGWLTKAKDQINPFDNGKTWQNPTPAPAQPSFGQQYRNVVNNNPIARVVAPVARVMETPFTLPFTTSIDAIKAATGQITGNQVAQNNAAAAWKHDYQPLVDLGHSFTRPVPEILNTFRPGAQTYTPGSSVEKAIFGQTPVSNVQKKVGDTYSQHGNDLKLASLEFLASMVQDLPVIGGVTKGLEAVKPNLLTGAQQTAAALNKGAKGIKDIPGVTAPRPTPPVISNEPAFIRNAPGPITQTKNAPNAVKDAYKANRPASETPAFMRDKSAKDAQTLVNNMTYQKALAEWDKSSLGLPAEPKGVQVIPPAPEPRLPKGGEVKPPPPTPKVSVKATIKAPEVPKVTGPEPSYGGAPGKAQPLRSKTTALRQINTDSSHKLADKMTAIEHDKQDMRGTYRNTMSDAFKLNDSEFNNLGHVIEDGAKPMNDRVAQAVPGARAAHEAAHVDYTGTGSKTGYTKNYFSRDYSALKKEGVARSTALQHLVDTGQAKDLGGATRLLDNTILGRNTKPGYFGSFDAPRLDIPGYSYTKSGTQNYLNGAAERTAQARHFGAKGEVASKLISNVGVEGGDAKTAGKAVENFLRAPEPGVADKPLKVARGAYGATRLFKAAISHVGQDTNTALVTRGVDTAKGVLTRFTKEGRDFIEKADVNNPANIHGLSSQETGVKGAASKITAPGLSTTMKVKRGDAALAGRSFGHWLAKQGDSKVPFQGGTGVGELRRLGVTGEIGPKLTAEQEYQAARGVTNEAMFSPSRADTPINAETTAGKTAGQYRLAYAYKQPALVINKVVREAAKGNLRPLGKYMALSAPVAAGTVAIKNKISGRNEGPGGIAMDTAAALGGIPGELALNTLRYGKNNVPEAVASAVAPLAGEAVKIADATGKAFKGNPKPAERYVAGLVPGVGPRLADAVAPPTIPVKGNPNAGIAANPNSSQAKADATAQMNKLRQNPDSVGLRQLPNGKYAYTNENGQVTETESLKNARDALAKKGLKESSDSSRTIGNKYYYKDENGDVKSVAKYRHEFDIADSQNQLDMYDAKDNGDLTAWGDSATKQLKALETLRDKYNQDSQGDKVNDTQKKIDTLKHDMTKYASYGGFTKGSGTNKKASFSTTGFASATKSKISAPKGITVKQVSSGSSGSRPTRKPSVSKIPSNYLSKKLA